MKKTIGVALVLLLGIAATVYFVWIYPYNPYHNGKWVYTWKDQAIDDPDPAARREATDNLIQAFRQMMRGQPRIQLVLHCCGGRTLPKELVPFLIEAIHAPEFDPVDTYPSMALSKIEDEAAIPALVEVLRSDEDAHARGCAVSALGMMRARGSAAEPDLRRALGDKDAEVRRPAERALKAIGEGKQGK